MSFPSSSIPLSGETNMVTVLDKLPGVPYAYSSYVDYFHKNKISKELRTKQFQWLEKDHCGWWSWVSGEVGTFYLFCGILTPLSSPEHMIIFIIIIFTIKDLVEVGARVASGEGLGKV